VNETELVEKWRSGLRPFGFDLVEVLSTQRFNESAATAPGTFRLPSFDRSSALCLLVAHSQALWEPFTRAVHASKELEAAAHPLDCYTESAVRALQRETTLRSLAFFSHQSAPVVPFQRLADAAGLAELSPSHLSVHPELGPWLGLRAAVVFDMEAPPERGARPARRCPSCSKPCLNALGRAKALERSDPERAWRAWLGVRDSCPVGRAARYSEAQIRYHYTKARSALG